MHVNQSRGFSLVELMVVIAVVAILAVAAMPSYRDILDRYRLGKATDDVISLVSNARSGAVKLHRQVNVSFATGASWCAGANAATPPTAGDKAGDASACTCGTPSTCSVNGETLVIAVGAHPGVQLTGASGDIVFDGVVGATTGLGVQTLALTSPAAMYTATVRVTPLGQATAAIVKN